MVGTPRTLAIQKEVLAGDLASLSEQYSAVMKQRRQLRDERDRLLLKKQADDLLEQMKQVEADLEKLENSENNSNHSYLDIQANLPKIDFQKAMNTVDKIMSQFGRQGGAALFLLENSYQMAGELCISRIRERIKYYQETQRDTHVRHIQVDILSISSCDHLSLLRSIGSYFDIQFEANSDTVGIDAVTKKMCKSIQNNSIIFLEIDWDFSRLDKKIFIWFIENFWCRLIDEYRAEVQTRNLHNVKLLTVIKSKSKLEKECLQLTYCCNQDDFNSKKILKLFLGKWTQKDIKEWLRNYLDFPPDLCVRKARDIYQLSSNGLPRLVYDILIKEEFV